MIDDEQPIRDLVTALLIEEGWEAQAFPSARSALTAITDGMPYPDLILLDMRMPGMDGWQFVAALRELEVSVPIVVMTAAQDARRWAEEVGAIAYLPKPFDIDRVLEEVERVLGPGPRSGGAMQFALDALRRLSPRLGRSFTPEAARPSLALPRQGRPMSWSTGA